VTGNVRRTRRELRVEVIRGGRPDAETVAAIGLAIDATLGPLLEEGGVGSTGGTPPSAWRRAALREGVGGAVEVGPGTAARGVNRGA
jgi:hypothetical protein